QFTPCASDSTQRPMTISAISHRCTPPSSPRAWKRPFLPTSSASYRTFSTLRPCRAADLSKGGSPFSSTTRLPRASSAHQGAANDHPRGLDHFPDPAPDPRPVPAFGLSTRAVHLSVYQRARAEQHFLGDGARRAAPAAHA